MLGRDAVEQILGRGRVRQQYDQDVGAGKEGLQPLVAEEGLDAFDPLARAAPSGEREAEQLEPLQRMPAEKELARQVGLSKPRYNDQR